MPVMGIMSLQQAFARQDRNGSRDQKTDERKKDDRLKSSEPLAFHPVGIFDFN